jgi:glycosyltransferase involved in cell wall biosynthesis
LEEYPLSNQPHVSSPAKLKSVAFYTSAMSSGGAERQWCHLATAIARKGIKTCLLTNLPMVEGGDHYEDLLVNSGVKLLPVAETPQTWKDLPLPSGAAGNLLLALPPKLREETSRLVLWLLKLKPDMICCQLDPTNLQGALAGIIAGVPRILLSFRNMRPTLMPHFCQDWFQETYQALERFPQIVWTGNSLEGNRDYADWLGWDAGKIHHLPNIFEPSSLREVRAEEIEHLRQKLAIKESSHVILSVCRLSPEKQPDHALQAFEILARENPDVVFVQVGTGPMQEELISMAQSMGIADRCRFEEATNDLSVYYSVASAFVLASRIEGTPNVLLEAQYFGTPIAAYSVGGVPSCVESGKTAFLAKPNQVDDLARSLQKSLNLRLATGPNGTHAGRKFLKTSHSQEYVLEKLLDFAVRC